MEFKKASEFELEVRKDITVTQVVKYNRRFIRNQIADIRERKRAYIAERDAEIAELQTILDQMDLLKIEETPVNPDAVVG